ncbi:ABC transporter ATP-binding protein [Melissococcus plutonius]|uniref:ABC transporter ATP-binding protein n=1 Tax=Melissococcus plutonius TaxID=33970 RepID=UPI003C2FC1D7
MVIEKGINTKTKKEKPKFSLQQFIYLIKITKPKYPLLILGTVLLIISASVQIYVPKLTSSLVNNFSKGIDYSLLIKVVILFVISAIMSAIGGTVLGIFGEDVIQSLRTKLWDKLTILKVAYFDKMKAGEMSSRLVNDSSQIKQLLATTIPQTFSSLILVIGSVYMMIRMDWQICLAMLIAVPVFLAVMFPMMIFGMKIGRIRQDTLAQFNGITNETLNEIRLVKTSNAEKQARKEVQFQIKKLFKVGKKEASFNAVMQPFMMMLFMSMVFGLLALGMHRVATGTMKIGILMSFLMYLFNLIGALPNIAMLFSELAKAAGATKHIQTLLYEETENLNDGKLLDLTGKTIEFTNVDFSYDTEKKILENVSFEAKPNQIIAFAGPSGGGKSTIFSLLERFYEPRSGTIQVGGEAIEQLNLKNYRSQIGFVSQDSAIMAGTIRENLIYGLEEQYTDEELWHVLELAYARKFVEAMPNGLLTEVGERGIKISGGQKQRIAIARAFLRDPKVLMLDEATASLDSESEMMIQKALNKLMEGRTTLVIAHRLATIVDSDRIYFIEKGRITGQGTHQELVENHAVYARYVNEQFRLEE